MRLVYVIAILMVIVFVSAGAIGLVNIKSQIASAQLEINSITYQKRELEKDNNTIVRDISNAANIDYIRKCAEAMGMGFPDSEHLIKLNKNDSELNASFALYHNR